MEKYIFYLLYSRQSEQALQLIELYQARLPTDPISYYSRQLDLRLQFIAEPSSPIFQLLELKLAAEVDANNEKGVLSVSDKIIGITDNMGFGSYWGHYFKARHLMASGKMKGAVELLFSALNNFRLGTYPRSKSFRYIVEALNEISMIDPSLIAADKIPLIEVARIDLAL